MPASYPCLLAAALSLVGLPTAAQVVSHNPGAVRIATLNASLSGGPNGLVDELNAQFAGQLTFQNAKDVAEVLQRTRPDVVLINEFDFNASNAQQAIADLQSNFFATAQDTGLAPINYAYSYVAPVNTGVASGFDLDNNGVTDMTPGDEAYGNDSFGFGFYPGQFGMVLLSQYEITEARTFQEFLWDDMPGARLPDDPRTAAPEDWYSPAELAEFRLSSKSHWDLTLDVDGQDLHVLASHPTPPVFDEVDLPGFPDDPFEGELVDYNGLRNADEIRFWEDYIQGASGPTTEDDYIYDDDGVFGGLDEDDLFVILGDLNADADEGDGIQAAIQSLLNDPLVNDTEPESLGFTAYPGDANDPFDTATFELRADYVLPSSDLGVIQDGVFWPLPGTDAADAIVTTDHRLVYVDIVIPEPATASLFGLSLLGLAGRRRLR